MQSDAIILIDLDAIRIRYPDPVMHMRYRGCQRQQYISVPNPNHSQDIVVGRISTLRTTHIQINTKRNIAQRICQ